MEKQKILAILGSYMKARFQEFCNAHTEILASQEETYTKNASGIMNLRGINPALTAAVLNSLTVQMKPSTPIDAYCAYVQTLFGKETDPDLEQFISVGSAIILSLGESPLADQMAQILGLHTYFRSTLGSFLDILLQKESLDRPDIEAAIKEKFGSTAQFMEFLRAYPSIFFAVQKFTMNLQRETAGMDENKAMLVDIITTVVGHGWKVIGDNFSEYLAAQIFGGAFEPVNVENHCLTDIQATADDHNKAIEIIFQRIFKAAEAVYGKPSC